MRASGQAYRDLANGGLANGGRSRLSGVFLALTILLMTGLAAGAQDFVAGLDRAERRVVQAALARAGQYDGLIDGAWGARSARSFAAFADSVADTARGEAPVLALLMRRYARDFAAEGWAELPDPGFGLRFVAPFGGLVADGASRWRSADATREVAALRDSESAMRARHATAEAAAAAGTEVYTLRREGVWITAADLPDGRLYVRSRPMGGIFHSMMVRVTDADRGVLMLVAGSVVTGPLSSLAPPQTGPLAEVMGRYPDQETALPQASAATGLWVGMDALLVPAAAVAGCAALRVGDGSAEVLRASPDLAVVRAQTGPGPGVARFAPPGGVALGMAVRAVGRLPSGEAAGVSGRVVALRAAEGGDAGGGVAVAGASPAEFEVTAVPPDGAVGWVLTNAGGAVAGHFVAGAEAGRVRPVDDMLRVMIESGIGFDLDDGAGSGDPPTATLRCAG